MTIIELLENVNCLRAERELTDDECSILTLVEHLAYHSEAAQMRIDALEAHVGTLEKQQRGISATVRELSNLHP